MRLLTPDKSSLHRLPGFQGDDFISECTFLALSMLSTSAVHDALPGEIPLHSVSDVPVDIELSLQMSVASFLRACTRSLSGPERYEQCVTPHLKNTTRPKPPSGKPSQLSIV